MNSVYPRFVLGSPLRPALVLPPSSSPFPPVLGLNENSTGKKLVFHSACCQCLMCDCRINKRFTKEHLSKNLFKFSK